MKNLQFPFLSKDKKRANKLSTKLFQAISRISFLSILLLSLIWFLIQWTDAKNDISKLEDHLLTELDKDLNYKLQRFENVLGFSKQEQEDVIQNRIKSRVYGAYQVVEHLYNTHKQTHSRQQIIELTKQHLRPIKFFDGRGYYYLYDLKGTNILHPINPEIEGSNRYNFIDPDGNYFIKNSIARFDSIPEYFSSIRWKSPQKGKEALQKIVFQKLYAPLQMFIGSGEYEYALWDKLKSKEHIERVSKLIDSKNIFVINSSGEFIYYPKTVASHLQNVDHTNLKNKIVNFIQSRKPDSTYISTSETIFNKSHRYCVKYKSEYNWIIGTFGSLAPANGSIEAYKEAKHAQLYGFLFVLIIAIAGIYFLSRAITIWYTRKLRKNLDDIKLFFKEGIETSQPIKTGKIHFQEIKEIAHLFNSILDTKLKAERMLQREQVYFQEIFKNSPEGIVLLDEESNIIRVNKGFLNMFGYEQSECIGQPLDELIVSEGFYGEAIWHTKEVAQGEQLALETMRKHKNGNLVHVSILCSQFKLHDDEMVSFGIYRDITARKIASENLKEEEQKWRSLYKNLPGATFTVDEDNKITQVNSFVCEMSQYSKEELIDQDYSLLFEKDKAGTQLMKEHPAGIDNLETYLIRKDGIKVPILKSSRQHPINSHNIIVENFLDISRLKVAEAKLEKARIQAEESDQLKTAFLANMSHEIRTPMNAIIGFSSLLNDGSFSIEEKEEFISIIKTNGDTLLMLIDDIIDISQIESGLLKINKTTCEPHKILLDVSSSLKERLVSYDKEHIDIKLSLPHGYSDLEMFTDQYRFRQILVNLIGNAIKFTKMGYIEIGYKVQDNQFLEFYVKDTGIGIPEDQQAQVFSRFKQVENKNAKKSQGNGLGLTITQNLIQLLGGEIGLESEVGVGSRFYFTLPYAHKNRNKISEDNTSYEAYTDHLKDINILIAEDSHANFMLLKKTLEKEGAIIHWVQEGNEAVRYMKEHPQIDIILMDIQMPNGNGYEAAEKIKQFSDVPIIAQTAYAMSGEEIQAKKNHCDDYLAKPIRLNVLITKLREYLQNKLAEEELVDEANQVS